MCPIEVCIHLRKTQANFDASCITSNKHNKSIVYGAVWQAWLNYYVC